MEYSPASSLCAMFSLQGQVAVVTGASRGLGKSMATKLAEVGAHVVLVARSQDQLEANVAELTQRHLKASFKVVDCSDEPAINTAMAAIFEEHGKIDILVNNAGLIMRKPATETTAPEWLGVLSDHNGHTCLSSCEPAFARYYGHQPQWSILLGKRSSAVHGKEQVWPHNQHPVRTLCLRTSRYPRLHSQQTWPSWAHQIASWGTRQ